MAENEKNKEIRGQDATVTNNLPYLPEDIIYDLLSELPVKSLVRFRCVSKSWCTLIDHPDFVKMHLTRSIATMNNRSIVSVLRCERLMEKEAVRILSVDFDDWEQEGEAAVGVEFDTPFPIPVRDYVLVSCNGLVYMFDSIACLRLQVDLPTFLVNPSTRRHRKLPCSHPDFPSNSNCAYLTAYGFGFDPTTEDYKVIRVLEFANNGNVYRNYIGFEVKVYSMSSNSWRRIEDIPLFEVQHEVGVFTNSAFHWVSEPKTAVSTSIVIVSIDTKDYEYRELPLPDIVENYWTMTVGVLGEKLQLCILCDRVTPHVELWVMKDYGVRNSWEKQFLIQDKLVLGYFNNYVRPVCYSRKGEVLFETNRYYDEDSGTLVLYDPHKVTASILRHHDKWNTICIGSLVSLNMKNGAD